MNTAVAVKDNAAELIEAIIAKGDFSKLTTEQRNQYYAEVCRSAGLNPLTQPFAWIVLNNKLTLYALRNATDQLRTIHKVSVTDMHAETIDGVYVVTTKVANGDGRSDIATGAVTVANLKGEALANAFMKAETKSKRRATLSLCGLGLLDETELETIPSAALPAPRPAALPSTGTAALTGGATAAAPAPAVPVDPSIDPETGEVGPRTLRLVELSDGSKDWIAFGRMLIAAVTASKTGDEVNQWVELNQLAMDVMKTDAPKVHDRLDAAIRRHVETLKGSAPWAGPS